MDIQDTQKSQILKKFPMCMQGKTFLPVSSHIPNMTKKINNPFPAFPVVKRHKVAHRYMG